MLAAVSQKPSHAVIQQKKCTSSNLLPGITDMRGLCVAFFRHCLNCAVPRTTFRTFVHRNMPLRLLLGQGDSKTAYRKGDCNNNIVTHLH